MTKCLRVLTPIFGKRECRLPFGRIDGFAMMDVVWNGQKHKKRAIN